MEYLVIILIILWVIVGINGEITKAKMIKKCRKDTHEMYERLRK